MDSQRGSSYGLVDGEAWGKDAHIIPLYPLHLGRALAGATNDSKERDEKEDKRKQDQQEGD